jgi:hypothetical protein
MPGTPGASEAEIDLRPGKYQAYFTGITNGFITGGMNFEYMRDTYFNNWTKPPGDLVTGKVYHYTKSDILLARNRV